MGSGSAAPNSATYDAFDGNGVTFYRNGARNADGTEPGGYFFDLSKAIDEARHFIYIVDWSFHPMLVLKRVLPAGQLFFKNADTIGATLAAKAGQGVLVAIHVWNHTSVGSNGAPDEPNDNGRTWLSRIVGGSLPSNLLWRSSSRTTAGMSHHQKFVVLDAPVDPSQPDDPNRQIKAFFGGLDITRGRLDFSAHPNLPDDPETAPYRLRTRIDWDEKGKPESALFNDWYNAEFFSLNADDQSALNPDLPRETWHDIGASISGPTAWDFVREFTGRWNCLEGGFIDGDQDAAAIKKVLSKYAALLDDSSFVQQDAAPGGSARAPWKARVLRSLDKDHWGFPKGVPIPTVTLDRFNWKLPGNFERSIQDFYIDAIRGAERFIYIESQYFIGSGKRWAGEAKRDTVANTIPEAIVERTKRRIEADKPFHTYVVMPMFPEGPPNASSTVPQWQRQWEFETMKYMATEIQKAAIMRKKNWFHYLTFLFPMRWVHLANAPSTTGARTDRIKANKRYMVYVHSKWMIVDDRCAILGSANLNERSLAGDRDSEICVFLEAGKSAGAAVQQLTAFRTLLWSEHLLNKGTPADPNWTTPESDACVAGVAGAAFRNYLYFRRGLRHVNLHVDDGTEQGSDVSFGPDGQLLAFPFDFVKNGLPNELVGKFGVINSNKLSTGAMEPGAFSLTQMRELGEILKRQCPEGDAFLPDPENAQDENKWAPVNGQFAPLQGLGSILAE